MVGGVGDCCDGIVGCVACVLRISSECEAAEIRDRDIPDASVGWSVDDAILPCVSVNVATCERAPAVCPGAGAVAVGTNGGFAGCAGGAPAEEPVLDVDLTRVVSAVNELLPSLTTGLRCDSRCG
jgi:hypothetical protein